jgi:hypothetical protein
MTSRFQKREGRLSHLDVIVHDSMTLALIRLPWRFPVESSAS